MIARTAPTMSTATQPRCSAASSIADAGGGGFGPGVTEGAGGTPVVETSASVSSSN
ncbi:unannotated protein [freshwater metagenome]|uniref:Unannotated protein n=1 Tax=freshwater metagenome TaxID=449393 RepID=A0A6J6PMV4_9ZZZZ